MSLLATIIIVSQGRPGSLVLTLDALCYQTLPEFEVIVVGGAEERRAVAAAGFTDDVNFVDFRHRNIAAARNHGLSAANGDIIAFLDDDAVPGPGWIKNLMRALTETGADYAAGYVRGPDGVGFQFTGAFLFADATHEPIGEITEIQAFDAQPGRAVEAMGTNVAYTRAAMDSAAGFDPGFAYFLDESDLNWRLARAGAMAAVAPRAQVVHALAPSPRRSVDRVPHDLFDIGCSTRVFLGKHFDGDVGRSLSMHRARHEERLMRHVRAGRLDPGRVSEILGTFDQGTQADPSPHSASSVPRSDRLMRSLDSVTRLRRQRNWFGKETLSYSGGGVWIWNKPHLRRAARGESIASVPVFVGAQ